MNEMLIIYHSGDNDGFGSAWVMHKFLGQFTDKAEFLGVDHGDPVPDVTGKNVIVVDFYWSRKIVERLYEQANQFLLIDHHDKAEKTLGDLDYCLINQERSAIVLTLQHILKVNKMSQSKGRVSILDIPPADMVIHDYDIPDMILYIEDRDLYKLEKWGSREFAAGLSSYPRTFEQWDRLYDFGTHFVIEQGAPIVRSQDMYIKHFLEQEKCFVIVDGLLVPVVNTTYLTSEIGHELCRTYPMAILYHDTITHRKFSLRGNGTINVSEIASRFGGGGHPNAAGFNIPWEMEGVAEMLAQGNIWKKEKSTKE